MVSLLSPIQKATLVYPHGLTGSTVTSTSPNNSLAVDTTSMAKFRYITKKKKDCRFIQFKARNSISPNHSPGFCKSPAPIRQLTKQQFCTANERVQMFQSWPINYPVFKIPNCFPLQSTIHFHYFFYSPGRLHNDIMPYGWLLYADIFPY